MANTYLRITPSAKFGRAMIRNVVNVDALSTTLFAFAADHSDHGIAITVASSCAITSSITDAGQALLDQIGDRWLAGLAELRPHVARHEVAEPPDVPLGQRLVEVELASASATWISCSGSGPLRTESPGVTERGDRRRCRHSTVTASSGATVSVRSGSSSPSPTSSACPATELVGLVEHDEADGRVVLARLVGVAVDLRRAADVLGHDVGPRMLNNGSPSTFIAPKVRALTANSSSTAMPSRWSQ